MELTHSLLKGVISNDLEGSRAT